MNRLLLLVGAFCLFAFAPRFVARVPALPARWRVRILFLSLLGIGASSATLLAAAALPEILVVDNIDALWELCNRIRAEFFHDPVVSVPSILGGVGLALVLGRLVWVIPRALQAVRRARVQGASSLWRIRGVPVQVIPVELTAAYSAGVIRPQIVVTEGLLDVLDDGERQAVLLHEEGHVRARHNLMLLVARAISAALRPLPPASAVLAKLERAAEEWADDYAASAVGAETVASSLSKAALAGLASPVGALSIASGPEVPDRVRRQLSPARVPRWGRAVCVLVSGGLVGALIFIQAVAVLAVLAAAHHVVAIGGA